MRVVVVVRLWAVSGAGWMGWDGGWDEMDGWAGGCVRDCVWWEREKKGANPSEHEHRQNDQVPKPVRRPCCPSCIKSDASLAFQVALDSPNLVLFLALLVLKLEGCASPAFCHL